MPWSPAKRSMCIETTHHPQPLWAYDSAGNFACDHDVLDVRLAVGDHSPRDLNETMQCGRVCARGFGVPGKGLNVFDKMISKVLIEWLWVLASAGVVIAGLGNLFSSDGNAFIRLIITAIGVAIGLVVVRLLCEAMIVVFTMHENLLRSRELLEVISRQRISTISSAPATPGTSLRHPYQSPATSGPANQTSSAPTGFSNSTVTASSSEGSVFSAAAPTLKSQWRQQSIEAQSVKPEANEQP